MSYQSSPDTAERPSNSIEFKSILLVDDDKQLAVALQWILADENFMVDVAYNGADALLKVKANEYDAVVILVGLDLEQRVSANEYDAVVCDVMMPELRGDDRVI